MISGVVTAIAAVYVRVAEEPTGGWTAALGSAWLEPLTTTADTRQPDRELVWGPPANKDEEGNHYRGGYPLIRTGDELLSGWVFTLEDEEIDRS